jgi:hypothetical protein
MDIFREVLWGVISLCAAHSHNLNLCDIYLWRTGVQEDHVYATMIKMKRGGISRGKFPPSQEGLARECKRCKVKPQRTLRTTPPPDTHRRGDLLGLRVNLNASEKKIYCTCWVSNPNSLMDVVTSHSLVITSTELSQLH